MQCKKQLKHSEIKGQEMDAKMQQTERSVESYLSWGEWQAEALDKVAAVESKAGKCGYAKVFAWRDGCGRGSVSCADVEARCTEGGLSVRWQFWVETKRRVGSHDGEVVDLWDGLVEFTEVVAVEAATRILKSYAKELSYTDGGAGATVECPLVVDDDGSKRKPSEEDIEYIRAKIRSGGKELK